MIRGNFKVAAPIRKDGHLVHFVVGKSPEWIIFIIFAYNVCLSPSLSSYLAVFSALSFLFLWLSISWKEVVAHPKKPFKLWHQVDLLDFGEAAEVRCRLPPPILRHSKEMPLHCKEKHCFATTKFRMQLWVASRQASLLDKIPSLDEWNFSNHSR